MINPLAPDALRKICPPESLPFEGTDELKPLDEVIAQDRAVEAITFGVGIRCEGFNLFVLGPAGAGKTTAIKRFLASEAAKLQTLPIGVMSITSPTRNAPARSVCRPAAPASSRPTASGCWRS